MDDERPNTMAIFLTVDSEEDYLDIGVEHNFGEDLSEEARIFYLDALNGIVAKVKFGLEELAFTGMLMRNLAAHQHDDDEDVMGIDFEPSEELLQAMEDRKIIKFKKKIH